jgi:hypothetical protein
MRALSGAKKMMEGDKNRAKGYGLLLDSTGERRRSWATRGRGGGKRPEGERGSPRRGEGFRFIFLFCFYF